MQVRWSAPSGARRCEVGIVEDFSSGGASLFLGVPVPPHTGIALDTDARTLFGIVRHCSVHPNGYVVGVEFDNECSREDYRPEHLLDVSRLDFSSDEDDR
jgi:hypothetical protein